MSKLVEELRKYVELKRSSTMRVTRTEAVELLAHIERLEANQIPEGCVAVPREPTREMHSAGRDAYKTEQSPITPPERPDRWRAYVIVDSHGWRSYSW